ncbi:hypothetical protein VIGAN_04339600 [Vigna angularis var. angularis]|uniref:Uncharacterized protein n=1 Tax=Vigna angularis var. angularis TaxID=157739 RepID=A0A0S3RZ64_PHAAN|nr:hypothetical protein VIGAN_04339600 [Vigna angularis var. angularis]
MFSFLFIMSQVNIFIHNQIYRVLTFLLTVNNNWTSSFHTIRYFRIIVSDHSIQLYQNQQITFPPNILPILPLKNRAFIIILISRLFSF